MLPIVAAFAARPDVAPEPVVPYYETDRLITGVYAEIARAHLTRELREAGLKLFLEYPNGLQTPLRPSSSLLEDSVVLNALVAFIHHRAGAELDLVAEQRESYQLLVTYRWDPGRYVITKARAPRGLYAEGPTEAVLREKWGIGPLVAIDRPFDPIARGLLDDAFGLLTADELPYVARISFQRRGEPTLLPMGHEGSLAAEYVGAEDRRPRIQIYDAALRPTGNFVGLPTEPHPFPVHVILHELGHAVADAPNWAGRLLVEDLRTAHSQDGFVLESLRDVTTPEAEARRAALVARMEVRKTAAEAVLRCIGGGRRIEAAWARAVGDELAPTRYGRTSPVEGFAEAFALFHTDRAALERASPRSAAWFAAGGHLEAAAAAAAELDALAAPGFRQ